MRVNENQEINQQELSSKLLVDKTTTGKAVNKLVAKGLLTKEKDNNDKRNYRLSTTKKGKEICEFLKKEEQYVAKVSLNMFSKIEIKILLKQLAFINKNISQLYLDIKDRKEDYLTIIQNEKIKD